jgi:pyruvate-formate lyase
MSGNEAGERIKRIKKRYREDVPVISIERARYYTDSWRETEGSGLACGIRVATAMGQVYEKMNHCVDPDDRIAGTLTENYLGIPLDIERGLFNQVMEVELGRASMLAYLLRSNARFVIFMLKKYGAGALYKSLKNSSAVGAAMPSIGLEPLDKRKINPYCISRSDKRILKKDLLPYWKGKTIADMLSRGLADAKIYPGEMSSFSAALPSSTSRNDTIISTGAALGTWQGHLVLDHQAVLEKGLLRMREEVRAKLEDRNALSTDERDFLRSVDIAFEGVITYARRLADKVRMEHASAVDPKRRSILQDMLSACERVPLYPAENFREAVQSYWTVKTAVELAIPFNVHSPGRLDQMLYPYYERDIRDGKISRDEARELLEELFLKVMSHNMRPYSNFTRYFAQRYEGSEPVTMGGRTREGKDATNDLTYVMLEAAARSKASLNFVVRLHKDTPEELFMKVAELQYEGNSSISVMNDEVSVEALENKGIPTDDALDFAVTGCVDMCVPGKTGGESFSAILLCRILDMTLRNGDSKTLVGTIPGTGPKTGDPDSFDSFDELVDAFVKQVSFQIDKIAEGTKIRDRLFAEYLPAPYISAFMDGCVASRKDVTHGGAVYDLEGILVMNSIANSVDSLYVIKKLVFEQRLFTIGELVEAVDNNFTGYDDIFRAIHELEGKWGNGNPESDELAREVTARIFQEMEGHRTFKEGFFAPFINSMTSHTYDGRISLATPDGRKAAMPFAASCNPYNVDRHGPTGVLRSVSALDFSEVMGSAVNIRMHPSGIGKTEEARRKWMWLIKSYFELGGAQLQPTVVSTEMLRAAQAEPEDYGDIIVKVGGYSAYFTDLGHEIQEEIISRSEHRSI